MEEEEGAVEPPHHDLESPTTVGMRTEEGEGLDTSVEAVQLQYAWSSGTLPSI